MSAIQILRDQHWHALPAAEVVDLLETDRSAGLDLFAARQRLEEFGPNAITQARGTSPIVRFLLQFNDPLIYILLAAGVVTVFLRDWVDATVIFAVVLLNSVIGYVQEARAVAAIEALRQSMSAAATVVRGGEQQSIAADAVVPGDLVLLQAGDKVPADLRLVRERELRVDESALTGESVPVDKAAGVVDRDSPLAERVCMAYASSLVTYGTGAGVVVGTGDRTEVGRISQLITEATDLKTPLTRKIEQFSKVLLVVILALAAVTFIVGVVRGEALADVFKASIALAVAAIPEGLPAAVTITLAIGVARMARRRAIIRKLPAVEALGSTTVICTDKTGTLTQNQMTVRRVVAAGVEYEVTGVGYAPDGEVREAGGAVREVDVGERQAADAGEGTMLRELLRVGLLCNDSRVVKAGDRWEVSGDPTEGALETAALKAGLQRDAEERALPRLDAIPFESQHQYMATLHGRAGGAAGPARVVYVKGAVEQVLERCATALAADGAEGALDEAAVRAQVDALARDGLRVLAFARGRAPEGGDGLHHRDLKDLTFLGLQAMIDPPRPEAITAVAACREAGVTVKMITGDHAATAAAIACQIGIAGAGDGDGGRCAPVAVTGADMARMKDRDLIDAAEGTNVFARVTPEQKLRLVEALQARGQVVAMTGDGVNDAPALKQADIGVAMGVTGTEVAKEAADMVLTDDNFASIEAAVEEGRGVFDNLIKFIAYAIPTNVGQGLVLLAAIFLGVALPILPLQILWVNMTTAVLLGLGLAFEAKEDGIMQRRPRRPGQPILERDVIVRIVVVGLLLLAGAFGLFELAEAAGLGDAAARTVAVNTFMSVQIFYLFSCRSLTRSAFQLNPLGNRVVVLGVAVMIVLQLLFTYLPAMNVAFETEPYPAVYWVWVVLVGFAAQLVVEALMWMQRRAARRTRR